MTRSKAFTVLALLIAVAAPSLANARDDRDDRRFDRNNGYSERRWDNNRYDHHRDNRADNRRDHDRWDRYDRYRHDRAYNNRTYYYPHPRNSVVIIDRGRPYDYPADYRSYSNSRTIIYGDGNRLPLSNGTTYYYYNR